MFLEGGISPHPPTKIRPWVCVCLRIYMCTLQYICMSLGAAVGDDDGDSSPVAELHLH